MKRWLNRLANRSGVSGTSARKQAKKLRLEALEERRLLTTFYVDGPDGDGPGGSDFNNGTSLETPFATIQRASVFAHAGDTIAIRGGTYRQQVNPTRSGTDGSPITYEAYNGEEVVMSGGGQVTGWTRHSGDIWVAIADWNANNDRDANTLFVDGQFQSEGRQHGENDLLDIDDWGLLKRGRLQSNASSFTVDDLQEFGNDFWNGARVKFHTHDWVLATRTIADFRSSDGRITLDSPVGIVSQKQDNGYYIFDALQTVDQPGEWYKEEGGNRLYYQVQPGQNPNNLDIEFKRRAFAFDLSGKEYIHLKDIEFRGASIDTDSNSDHNVIEGNRFYAYDKGNFGRFFISGQNNVLRDNEISHTWGSFVTVSGRRNEIVNNFIHDVGFNGTTRVISAHDAEELLVSHNTVSTFARSFMDGYPSRSEIAYNVFEDGGNLTWDTGVFDADGSNGDSSYSIFHHNVFRDTDSRGIFEAFYGRNDNAVVHHNLFYGFNEASSRTVFRSYGLDFRQSYHNTIVSDVDSAPYGNLDALNAIHTRYNNNVQISLERMEALGVDVQGNHNYSTSDFVDFNNQDFQLAAGSGAIDAGIVLPGINDGYVGEAPDAGAFEFGQPAWTAGHDFGNEPDAVFSWQAMPGTNLYHNGQFREGISDWTIFSGTANSRDRNSWNLAASGASLTGTFRTESVELTPTGAIRRTFTGLTPNTTYTLGATARVVNKITESNQYSQFAGSVSFDVHRDEAYMTGLSAGEWVKFGNIDFGDPGQFDQLDVLHIRDPADGFTKPISGASIQVRLDSAAGPLLAEFSDLTDGNTKDRWRANRESISGVSGAHSIYVTTTGVNGPNLAVGSFRLLQETPPTSDLLTVSVSSTGMQTLSAQFGNEDWTPGYDELSFTTGPTATSADVEFVNQGRQNVYLDRIYLVDGYPTRGGEPRDISTGKVAELSLTASTSAPAPGVVDGIPDNQTLTGDHPNSWIQVDLQKEERIHGIRLTPPSNQLERMSNFRVSVWSDDPNAGGVERWNQDYLTDDRSLGANESLALLSSDLGSDGQTRLGTVAGRFVRVQLLGQNNQGDHRLALGELLVLGFDEINLAMSDGTASQSSTAGQFTASSAIDSDDSTHSETQASGVNSWWQVRFPQAFSIGQIELVNRDDSHFNELSNFSVSVWDEDPNVGGDKLWEKSFFGVGSVGKGESLVIDGGVIGVDGFTRLATVHRGRVVRVQLNGVNNAGNGTLALANVRITSADQTKPQSNVALDGAAAQSNDYYGDVASGGFAKDANDGAILPLSNFTSTLSESNAWWQVDLQQAAPIEQIVLFNRQDAANRLNNFRVSVWDDEPGSGGTELWGRNYNYSSSAPYYSTTAITAGGALQINGSVTSGGTRLDEVVGGRFIRVQFNGSNGTGVNILSLAEVQVWSTAPVVVDPGQTNFDYDFGTNISPVPGGWTQISPSTTGDIYWSTPVGAVDRGAGSGSNDVNRDFVTSSGPVQFNHVLANGVWRITMNMGDATQTRNDMSVTAEGQVIDSDVDSPAGQFTYVSADGDSGSSPASFDVTITDGELNIELDAAGAASWVWNRLSISFVDVLPVPGDFNSDGSVDGNDFLIWQASFGNDSGGDADGDGDTDGDDFLIWQQAFNPPVTVSVISDGLTKGNGGMLTTTTATSVGQATTSETELVTNDNGRALVQSSATGDWVQIPGWRTTRVSYPGSNPAFGFDGDPNKLVGSEPAQYAFVNSGAITLVSDPILVNFASRDVIDLSYWIEGSVAAGTATATLTFDSGETHTFGSLEANTNGIQFTDSYQLFVDASSAILSFVIDTGDVGNQFKLDSVNLNVTSTASAAASSGAAAALSPIAILKAQRGSPLPVPTVQESRGPKPPETTSLSGQHGRNNVLWKQTDRNQRVQHRPLRQNLLGVRDQLFATRGNDSLMTRAGRSVGRSAQGASDMDGPVTDLVFEELSDSKESTFDEASPPSLWKTGSGVLRKRIAG